MPSINPQILVWARETAGYDLPDAAKKLNLNDSKSASAIEKLSKYESGSKAPSRSLLTRMAKVYRRPLLTFYLSSPPSRASRGEDFRTLARDIDPSQNAIVDALLRNINARQEIVREALLSSSDGNPLEFVGSYSPDSGTPGLVKLIKKTTEFDLNIYRSQKNQDAAFKYLRNRVEATGVYTILAGNLGSYHTNLSTAVFRGFALADKIAPFIVINDQDAKTAWSVTLLHELAHIWVGVTGISGYIADKSIEKFCDQTASELLVPESELIQDFEHVPLRTFDHALVNIDAYANKLKVSSRLIAYRLLNRGLLSQELFDQLGKHFYDRWRARKEQQKEKMRASEGGPSYYVLKKMRVGDALINVSGRLLRSGELSTTEAATVLGVRALKLSNMLPGSHV